MEQRKILILTNRIPYPYKDGGNLAMDTMIKGYHKMGWKVYLLSMNTTRHHVASKILENLYKELYAFEWVNIDNKIRWYNVVHNFFFSKMPEHAIRFYNSKFEQKLNQVLIDFMPDVVQVESVYLSTYLPVINSQPGVFTVLRLHNIEYHIWESLSARIKNKLKKYYFRKLTNRIRYFEKSSWKKYDLLLPITEKDASTVGKMEMLNKSFTAHFGIDINKINSNNIREKWVGYHIGAMDWIPNKEAIFWFLKSVWPLIHKAIPNFEFFFAGRYMPADLSKIKIEGVHCLNEVESAEDFIADKKILIVPLGAGSGVRVKILEAMAAGKIVITTTNGIKGIEAKHGEHYLLANRPEEFLKCINWCLNNKDKAEKIAENARQLVINEYNYEQISSSIIGILNKMIDDSRTINIYNP